MATMAGNKTFQIIRKTDSTPSKQVEFDNYDVFISDSYRTYRNDQRILVLILNIIYLFIYFFFEILFSCIVMNGPLKNGTSS